MSVIRDFRVSHQPIRRAMTTPATVPPAERGGIARALEHLPAVMGGGKALAGLGAGKGLTGLAVRGAQVGGPLLTAGLAAGQDAITRALERTPQIAGIGATALGTFFARPGEGDAHAPQPTPGTVRLAPVAPPTVARATPITAPPSQPAMPVGGFEARTPAPAAVRPPATPAAAPAPAALPPTPALAGGIPREVMGGAAPTPAALPPMPVLAGDIAEDVGQPIGQFEAMLRALQARQIDPSILVQMPMAGATPFGPAGAQAEALRRLRDQAWLRDLRGAAL